MCSSGNHTICTLFVVGGSQVCGVEAAASEGVQQAA